MPKLEHKIFGVLPDQTRISLPIWAYRADMDGAGWGGCHGISRGCRSDRSGSGCRQGGGMDKRSLVAVRRIGPFILMVLLFLADGGVVFPSSENVEPGYKPTIEISEAIAIAEKYADSHGYKLEDYAMDYVRLKGNEWIVFFQGKVPTVGNHFSIAINKLDKSKIALHPGK